MSSLAINLRFALGGIYVVLTAATVIDLSLRRLKPRLDLREVTLRIRSWWVMAIIFTVALLAHPAVSVGFFALVSGLAVHEYLRMEDAEGRTAGLVAYPAIAAQYSLVATGGLEYVMLVPLVTTLAVPATLALRGRTEGFASATGTVLLGIFLTVFAVGHAAFLLVLPEAAIAPAGAAGLLVYLVVLTQANDVAQFLWGKAIGRRPIAPLVSPNKTVGGLVGGVTTTALVSAALSPLLTPFGWFVGIAIGVGIGIAGFVGDLTISAAKRDVGVKDTGSLLPGHGGVLDRIDSLIFTAPLFFHLYRLFGG
ncbi:MAG: phosphatidate cytidylyltransferase [Acidimicrobiia bacterium]|nr:phosphatidate cytidylyltransferase [Acidimicrobiia bacterium]NNL97897.1 phosphatidate cytidylyltransferase [Acidimicrobiia bacterium]